MKLNEAPDAPPAEDTGRDPDILTTKELAAKLGITPLTIQGLRDKGIITYMDTGGLIRYSYNQVKQELVENAQRRREKRLAKREESISTDLDAVIKVLKKAVAEGQLLPPEQLAEQFGVSAQVAKTYITEAAPTIIKQFDLVSRNDLATEHRLDPRRVDAVMRRQDAPKPVFRCGKTFYYRRGDTAGQVELAKRPDKSAALTAVADAMTQAVQKGLECTAEELSKQLKIPISEVRTGIAEAMPAIVKRFDLVTRADIAGEHDVPVSRVATVMQGSTAPRPIFRMGRTLYYRRTDVADLFNDQPSPSSDDRKS